MSARFFCRSSRLTAYSAPSRERTACPVFAGDVDASDGVHRHAPPSMNSFTELLNRAGVFKIRAAYSAGTSSSPCPAVMIPRLIMKARASFCVVNHRGQGIRLTIHGCGRRRHLLFAGRAFPEGPQPSPNSRREISPASIAITAGIPCRFLASHGGGRRGVDHALVSSMSLAILDCYDEVAEKHGVSPFLDQRRDKFGEVQFVFCRRRRLFPAFQI